MEQNRDLTAFEVYTSMVKTIGVDGPVNENEEKPTGRARGRPKKAKPESTEPVEQPKSQKIEEKTQKSRAGRPKKHADEVQLAKHVPDKVQLVKRVTDEHQHLRPLFEAKSPPKPRGRAKKIDDISLLPKSIANGVLEIPVESPTFTASSQQIGKSSESSEEARNPKKRGRKKKNEVEKNIDVASSLDKNVEKESSDVDIVDELVLHLESPIKSPGMGNDTTFSMENLVSAEEVEKQPKKKGRKKKNEIAEDVAEVVSAAVAKNLDFSNVEVEMRNAENRREKKRKSSPEAKKSAIVHPKMKKVRQMDEHFTASIDNQYLITMKESQNSVKSFDDFVSSLQCDGNSLSDAERAFEWLIFPMKREHFMQNYFETKPCFIKRSEIKPEFYDGVLSTKSFERIVDKHDLEYGVNIDITQYEDGERETLNPEGKVCRKVLWDFYEEGCSIRMLNPQTFSTSIWRLTSTLQEFFGTFVGANVYLTPPGTQGFAPHYDDIEAFVLQLEGKKRWSVYQPKEVLPRFSSRNYKPSEVGQLVFSVELNPGDLLYMPRGYVHQASCDPDHHSLHLTVSSSQLNSYADLFDKLVPFVLKTAVDNDVEFRRSLPLDYMTYTGVALEDHQKNNPKRLHFLTQVKTLFKRLGSFLTIDAACDQMAKKFIHDSQPPFLNEGEKMRTVFGDEKKWSEEEEMPVQKWKKIDLQAKVRLLRGNCARLVVEGDSEWFMYYNVDNSRVYHGKEINKLDLTTQEAFVVEYLITSYPNFVDVSSFPLDNDEEKVTLCLALYEKRLLMTKYVLTA